VHPVASAVQSVLEPEAGYVETPVNVTKYSTDLDAYENLSGTRIPRQGSPWCGTFIDWGFWKAQAQAALLYRNFGTSAAARKYIAAGRFHTTSQPGDLAFKAITGAGHIGFVISAEDYRRLTGKPQALGYVATIEGNTASGNTGSQTNGGQVAIRQRPISFWTAEGGFGSPDYAKVSDTPVPGPPKPQEINVKLVIGNGPGRDKDQAKSLEQNVRGNGWATCILTEAGLVWVADPQVSAVYVQAYGSPITVPQAAMDRIPLVGQV
jgi:hypothetical protein